MLTGKTILMSAVLTFMMAFTISLAEGQDVMVSKIATAMTDSLAYLQLTAQQKTNAQALNTTAATSLVQIAQKAKADTSFKGKAVAQQVMGIMKQRNAGLTKMLTPDQLKLFEEHRLQQMAELQTKMMTAQLDLTDAQVPQVYAINLESTREMMEGMEKVQDSKRKLQKARAAKSIKSDSKDKDKELKKILSQDQYAKYEKNKEAMQAAMKEKMKEKKG
jgi:hypothetical protein